MLTRHIAGFVTGKIFAVIHAVNVVDFIVFNRVVCIGTAAEMNINRVEPFGKFHIVVARASSRPDFRNIVYVRIQPHHTGDAAFDDALNDNVGCA